MKAIVLSTNNYRSFPSRKQRFTHRLVQRGYDVLYVEAPVTLLAAAHPNMWGKLTAWRSGVRKQEPNLWIASPTPWLPYFKKVEAIADHDALTYLTWLRRLPGRWAEEASLVVTYLPFVPRTLELLGVPTVYDCVDDHSAYPGLIDRDVVDWLEQRTARIASAVIATNETIAAKLGAFTEKLTLIQNGVDHELFAAAAGAWLDTMEVLPREHKFLYAGAMREWFDTATLASVAAAFPGDQIDCFGEALPQVRRDLANYANIVFKGSHPQSEIAQIAPRYDVALIPFRESPLTQGVDPLKFYEYVSAGLPVVSSRIDALGAFDERMVRLAGTPEEFVVAIRETLAADSLDLRKYRVQASHRFDWSFRLAEFDRVVDAVSNKQS